ncbi:helix-turn-helix domain-containing protein [Marinobacterium litorale]|uniref:helix-turn-helix domain-containing protein n=1 Tax=Marinobacterium litorale TaxID=404770 RepID=UPI00146FB55F|nr:helix-turn-helix domain-containing protein [Marinobacterium litorale]
MTKTIDALARGMLVLDELRKRSPATLAELHQATAISKATLLRILKTLEHAGWVDRADSGAGYNLARAKGLQGAQGAHFDSIQQAAGRTFQELLDQNYLSAAVYVRNELQMSVLCALPADKGVGALQQDRPLLFSAEGQCYLAFCSDNERERIISVLKAAGGREELLLTRDRVWLYQMLETARQQGYIRYSVPDTASGQEVLAVPVLKQGRLVASLSVCRIPGRRQARSLQPDLYTVVQRAAGDIASRIPA